MEFNELLQHTSEHIQEQLSETAGIPTPLAQIDHSDISASLTVDSLLERLELIRDKTSINVCSIFSVFHEIRQMSNFKRSSDWFRFFL